MEKISNKEIQLTPQQILQRKELVDTLNKDIRVQQFFETNHIDNRLISRYCGRISNYIINLETCKKCQGLASCPNEMKGHYLNLVYQNDALFLEPQKCDKQIKYDQKYDYLKNYVLFPLPEEYRQADLLKIDVMKENHEYLKLCNILSKWLEDKDRNGIYFYGGFGVGKTFLASALTNALARQQHQIAFVNYSDFCRVMRNWEDNSTIQNTINVMNEVEILVLDDIGSELISDRIRDSFLENILNNRMVKHQLTLFTSNYDLDELLKRMIVNTNGVEDRISAERLIERIRMLADVVTVNGNNRRRKAI